MNVWRSYRGGGEALDVGGTIIEASKKHALRCYENTRGYQPQMAWWAEREVWVCDELRDGNVGANFRPRRFLERAFGVVPRGGHERRLRLLRVAAKVATHARETWLRLAHQPTVDLFLRARRRLTDACRIICSRPLDVPVWRHFMPS